MNNSRLGKLWVSLLILTGMALGITALALQFKILR